MVQSHINFNPATSPARGAATTPLPRVIVFAGVVSALGCAALFGNPVSAAAPVEFAQPSVEFSIDTSEIENGATSLMPTECNQGDTMCGTASFKVPIQLNVSNASKYNVSVWAETADLTSTTTSKTIPSVSSETTLSQLSNNWGYRWTFGSDKEDRTNPYIAMPTTSTTLRLGGATTTVSSADTLDGNPIDIDLPSPGTDNRYLTLGFGVNIDGDTPAGTYKNKIHIAATASPLKVTLFNLETMQQMTSDICANTTTPFKTASKTDTTFEHHGDKNYVPEVTLKDTRDGKTYLVRKLADGNCWMSQNLAFDFVDDQTLPDLIDDKDNPGQKIANPAKYYTGKTKAGSKMIYTGNILISDAFKLTSANTDLGDLGTNGEWTPSSTPSVRVFKTQASSGDNSTHPWLDDGSDGMRSFSNDGAYPNANYSVAAAIIGTAGDDAESRKFAAVASDYAGGEQEIDGKTYTFEAAGQPYQKFGNLYNWTAATLGTGIGKGANEEASASICPKGWRLPSNANVVSQVTSGPVEVEEETGETDGEGNPIKITVMKQNKSFINLLRNYDNAYGTTGINNANNTINIASFGYIEDTPGGDFASVASLPAEQSGINAYNQLAEFPLNLPRSGIYYRAYGYVSNRITSGYLWSNTAASAPQVYILSSGSDYANAQRNVYRGSGFPIRCVAR